MRHRRPRSSPNGPNIAAIGIYFSKAKAVYSVPRSRFCSETRRGPKRNESYFGAKPLVNLAPLLECAGPGARFSADFGGALREQHFATRRIAVLGRDKGATQRLRPEFPP